MRGPFGHSVDILQNHIVIINSQAVITYQGDIDELGLKGCHCLKMSYRTFPLILVMFYFRLKYIEHLFELILQAWLD